MIKESAVIISFTKSEYRTLVESLELANWILHAHAEEERKETKRFRELEQKILAFYSDCGMENEIEYDEKLEEYLPTRQFEDQVLQYVDEYNEDNFWEELIERLVRRDLIQIEGEQRFLNLSFEELFQKEDPIRMKYENEFEHHGLDNLGIHS